MVPLDALALEVSGPPDVLEGRGSIFRYEFLSLHALLPLSLSL